MSVRPGILSDNVVAVRNNSDKILYVFVNLYNGQHRAMSGETQIKPGETKEFGRLELEDWWNPTNGDKGFVEVIGYMHFVTFDLSNGRCLRGYSFGLPDDVPK